ncbi:MAG: hypothetical protein IPM54_26090 [Polyangiaceae bacterium]|nr:hypothetical protein [Polyangiaceae bacterium]
MGTIIRRDAAAEAIVEDGDTTLTKASARGGKWKELADERLGTVLGLVGNVSAQLTEAQQMLAPLEADVDTLNIRSDKVLGKTYDVIWNEIGRPGYDAALSVLFPEGIAYYAQGDTDEQPDRMDILVQLLQAGLHPKLSKATADACAAEVDAEAKALRNAVEAVRKPAAKVKVLSRVRTALARVVHTELSNLKRLYKVSGFSEAEIHTVIPDRPVKKKNEG